MPYQSQYFIFKDAWSRLNHPKHGVGLSALVIICSRELYVTKNHKFLHDGIFWI